LYEPLDHCQNTLSVLMQSTTPLFWSKYSPNTFRWHVLVCMNVVMASSSTASTEYALNISLRLHPLLCCTRAMMMDSLTSTPGRLYDTGQSVRPVHVHHVRDALDVDARP
jgi:hypothetical protein